MRSLFMILLLASAFQLWGQKEHTINKWTLSTELGFNIGESNSRFLQTNSLNKQYKKNSLGLNYRFVRWFESTSKLSIVRHYQYDNKHISNQNDPITALPFSINTNSSLLGLTIGGRLIFRIHQGDLALEGSYGANFQWQKVNAGDYYGKEFQYSYQAKAYTMSKLGISYTYWVNKKLGAYFSIESIAITQDELRNSASIKKEHQVPTYISDDDKYFLRAELPTNLNFVNLGLTYRL